MYRFFSSLVLVAVFMLTATYAGMAMFGMGAGMQGENGSCEGTACHTMPDAERSGMDCIEHCLSLVPAAVPAMPFSMVVMMGVVLLALALRVEAPAVDHVHGLRHRWREGIRKILLKEALATVVLRN